MFMRMRAALCCLVGWLAIQTVSAAPVLLISIDGLHPDYVAKGDSQRLKIPNLRSFIEEGTYAQGVIAVVPTIASPAHTTLLTGVTPAEHGIVANTTFDPLGLNCDGGCWHAEDLRVPTLWQAAAQARLRTASVNWPVTMGDKHIQYLIPEYWRTAMPDDPKLLRARSRSEGLLPSLEARLGPFVDSRTDSVEADAVRTRFSVALLRQYKPHFMATRLIALDGIEHKDGPYVPSTFRVLEQIDGMVGELTATALANDPASVVVIVSDHGFATTHTAVNLRKSFVEAGLIKLKEPQQPSAAPAIESWDAQLWSGGAVAAVVLRDPNDRSVRERVVKLLEELRAKRTNGIARIVEQQEFASRGYPEADLLIEFARGFYLGNGLRGDLLTPAGSKGMHGYPPEYTEMHAAFFIKGKGVAAGRELAVIDMRQIAPTLAKLLRVKLPSARAPALPIEAAIQRSE